MKEYLLGRLKWVHRVSVETKQQRKQCAYSVLQQQNFDQLVLGTELAEQLIDKTEGWFTGIQFTNLYLKEHQDIHVLFKI